MRNFNIISSIANGISNFVIAANDALRGVQTDTQGYLCLKPTGLPMSATWLHPGSFGTADQMQFQQPGGRSSSVLGTLASSIVERMDRFGRDLASSIDRARQVEASAA